MSNVVDSKVVELSLDNNNFEKNAATTISTVQNLQKALDFSVSGKNFDNINSSIKKVNFEPINKGIETAKSGFSALEAVAFGAFANIGKKISDVAIRVATAIPRQIVEGGKSRALNMEQAKFQIEGLGKAWVDVKDDVDYAVSGTAYGLDVAAKAASQLIASGVEFGATFGPTGSSPMAKALRGISGVAAMTSSSYEEISNIFTKVAGQGSIMGGELQQLAARGLNVAASLATFMSGVNAGTITASDNVKEKIKEITSEVEISEADIRDWASDRKISFDIFSEAMDNAYGEHATKANETFAGSLSNIKAQLSKIGEIFASPLMAGGQKVFSSLYDVVKDIRMIIGDSKLVAGFTAITDVVSTKLSGAFQKAHKALQGFMNRDNTTSIDKTKEAFSNLFGKIDEKTGFFTKMKDYFGMQGATEEVKESTKTINASFESVKDTVLATIRGDYGNGMARMQKLTEEGFNAETVQGYVNELWKLTGHDWSKLSEDIYAQVKGQKELSEATKETGTTTEEVQQKMTPLGNTFSGLANIFLGVGNIVGVVKGKFQELGKTISGAFTGEGGIIERVTTKFNALSQSFLTFTETHGKDIGRVFDAIVASVQLLGTAFGFAGKAIMSVLNGAFKGLGTSLWDVIMGISNATIAVRDWIVENKIIEGTLNAIKSVVETVTGKIRGLWDAFTSLPVVQSAVENFGKAFSFIGENFSSITKRGGTVLKNFWSMLRNGFKYSTDPKTLLSNIRGSFSYLWNQIKSSEVISHFKDAFGAVKKTFDDFYEGLGKNEDGSYNVFGKLQNTFGRFGKSVKKTFSEFRKDLDFTKLFQSIRKNFSNLWSGIEKSGFFDKVKNGFNSVTSTVKEFFKALGDNDDGTRNRFGKFTDFVVDGYSKVKQKITSIWGSVVDFFKKKNIGEFFVSNFDTLKKGFGDFFTSLPAFASGLREKFGDFLDRVTDLGGFKFSNIGEIWKAFKETLGQYFKDSELFKPITDAFSSVWDSIKNKIYDLGTNEDGSRNWFGKFTDAIYELRTTVMKELGTLRNGFADFFKNLPSFFSGIIPKFKEFTDRVKELGGVKFDNFAEIWKAFKETLGQYFKDSDVFKPISDAFDKVVTDVKAKLKEHGIDLDAIRAKYEDFKSKAGGIFTALKGIISSKLSSIGIDFDGILSKVSNVINSLKESFKDLTEGGPLQAIMNLFGGQKVKAAERGMENVGEAAEESGQGFSGFFDVIKEMYKGSQLESILSPIAGFLGRIGKAILEIKPETIFNIVKAFLAFKVIKGVWNEIKGIIKSFSDAITGLWKSTANLRNAKANFINKASLLLIAGAVAIIAKVIKDLASIEDMGKAWQAVGMVGAIFAALAIVDGIIGKIGQKSGNASLIAGASLLLIAGAVAAIGLVVKELSGIGDMGAAWQAVGMLGAILGGLTVVMAIGAAITPNAIGFGAGMLAIAGALYLGVQALKIFESIDFVGCVQKLVDAVDTWNKGIEQIEVEKGSGKKSTGLLGELEGITIVLTSASIAGFIKGVGDFVTTMLGQDDVLTEFKDGLDKLIEAVKTWNTFISDESISAGDVLQTGGFLLELTGINSILQSAALTGFLKGVGDFVTEWLGQDGIMEEFKDGVENMVGAIKAWHDGTSEISYSFGGAFNSASLLMELTAIDLVLKSTVITGFIKGVGDFVTEWLGQDSIMEEFKDGVENMVGAIKAWHDGIDNAGVTFGSFANGAALLLEISAITGVLNGAVISSFLQSVGDFVNNELFGNNESLIEQFSSDVEAMANVVTTWQEKTADIKAGVNFSILPILELISAISLLNSVSFWETIQQFVAGWFSGNNDFSENFIQSATDLGTGLKAFSDALKDVDTQSIGRGVTALNALSRLAEKIQYFIADTSSYGAGDGTANLTRLAQMLGDPRDGLGVQLQNFVNQVPDVSSLQGVVSSFDTLVSATNKLTKLDFTEGDIYDESKIQTLRTNISTLTGIVFSASGMGMFSGGITAFENAMKKLGEIKFSEGDIMNAGIIGTLETNINRLKGIIGGLSGIDTSGVAQLAGALSQVANISMTGIKSKLSKIDIGSDAGKSTGKQLSDNIASGVESSKIKSAVQKAINAAISAASTTKAKSVGTNLGTSIANAALATSSQFKSTGTKLGTTLSSAILATSSQFKSAGTKLGTTLGTEIANAVKKSANTVKSAVGSVISTAASAITQYRSQFHSAGYNLSAGLAAGISAGRSAVINAAIQTATSALRAAKEALQEHSPSKATQEMGIFFDEGLIIGIDKLSGRVSDAASNVGSMAVSALEEATKLVNKTLLGDGLNQPVITPIMDLSEIQNGARMIGDILGSGRPNVALGNLSAISFNANVMRQQSENTDILEAIKSLGSNLSNSSKGDTFIIDGITYDDGSNVSETVRNLIRAVKIDRRA